MGSLRTNHPYALNAIYRWKRFESGVDQQGIHAKNHVLYVEYRKYFN